MKRYLHLFVLSTAIISVQSCKKMDNAADGHTNAAGITTPPGGNPVSTPLIVTTFAGNGSSIFADGTGVQAGFDVPKDLVADSVGNIFVADAFDRRIRKITSAGVVTTLIVDSSHGGGPTGPDPILANPAGIAIDHNGNLYVADDELNQVRKFSPDGFELSVAGAGGFLSGGFRDGDILNARFDGPEGVAVDNAGNVYVADALNRRIRKIAGFGVSTLAGNGQGGSADGIGTAATFGNPTGVAVDAAGNVYVADFGNNSIRKITPSGVVTTLAGGTLGSADGVGRAAQFNHPFHLTVDASGNIYVTENGSNRIRKVTPAGVVTTVAGTTDGFADGLATRAQFSGLSGITINASGSIYVSETHNQRIRQISRLHALPDPPVVVVK